MVERIHDGEHDVGEEVVRGLLAAECPIWAGAPMEYLATSGTDNAMWRVRLDGEPDVVVRLPRRPSGGRAEREAAILDAVGRDRIATLVATPTVRHLGRPHDVFADQWSVLEWIDGDDAWERRRELSPRTLDVLAVELGRAVVAVGEIGGLDGVLPDRPPGCRGGPLRPLLDRLDSWLDDPRWDAERLIDVRSVRRLRAESAEIADEPVQRGVVHGDLIAGNLLLRHGRLAAVLDWGGLGRGDVAQDLAPAWSVLTSTSRQAFRAVVGYDEATWLRGRAFELEHAVGGVLYYVPRRHPLGDVMERTLERILDDAR